MSRFQTRLDHVASRFNEHNGELVTIRRPGALADTTGVTASPILKMADQLTPGVALTRLEVQDWAIDVAEYVVDGSPVFPQEKDIIIRASGESFRVTGLNEDDPCFNYSTSSRNRFLICSLRITEAT